MITEEQYLNLIKRLQNLEQHVINLIIPLQDLTNNKSIIALTEQLQRPFTLDSTNFFQKLNYYIDPLLKNLDNLNINDFKQTLNEIAYIGNRLKTIEADIAILKNDGLKKTVSMELFVDGKPINTEAKHQTKLEENTNKILEEFEYLDRTIVINRLGLFGKHPKTYSDLSNQLDLSEETIRRRYERTLRKMRKIKKDKYENVEFVDKLSKLI